MENISGNYSMSAVNGSPPRAGPSDELNTDSLEFSTQRLNLCSGTPPGFYDITRADDMGPEQDLVGEEWQLDDIETYRPLERQRKPMVSTSAVPAPVPVRSAESQAPAVSGDMHSPIIIDSSPEKSSPSILRYTPAPPSDTYDSEFEKERINNHGDMFSVPAITFDTADEVDIYREDRKRKREGDDLCMKRKRFVKRRRTQNKEKNVGQLKEELRSTRQELVMAEGTIKDLRDRLKTAEGTVQLLVNDACEKAKEWATKDTFINLIVNASSKFHMFYKQLLRFALIFCLILIAANISIFLRGNRVTEKVSRSVSHQQSVSSMPDAFNMDKPKRPCTTEIQQITFIKVHKAGSTTVANILFRFGVSRNLTFLIPAKSVAIVDFLPVPWKNVMPLPGNVSFFDILCSHSMYNPREIRRLMSNSTSVISIVRDPLDQLASAIYYYHPYDIPGEDKLANYLANPFGFEVLKEYKTFINNSMAYELGIPYEKFFDKAFINSHLQKLDRELDFVLVVEKMDESLVLLKRMYCWKLKDVIYLIRNVNSGKPRILYREDMKLRHMTFSPADYALHDFFTRKLEIILKQQTTEFWQEVAELRRLRTVVSRFCQNKMARTVIPKSAWSDSFLLTQLDCTYMRYEDDLILEYVKKHQYQMKI